jgi:hypothetical protein
LKNWIIIHHLISELKPFVAGLGSNRFAKMCMIDVYLYEGNDEGAKNEMVQLRD